MTPIKEFLGRHLDGCATIVDPFAGNSEIANFRNDLAFGGMDAEEFCSGLLPIYQGLMDAIIWDPPYSPRQISECYKSIGRQVTMQDTQNAALYKRCRGPLARLLKPGGIALSFGWQSSGFGKDWPIEEILLVQHGGAHSDTICVAQRKVCL